MGLILVISGLTGAILPHRHGWIAVPSIPTARSAIRSEGRGRVIAGLVNHAEISPRFVVLPMHDFPHYRLMAEGEAGAYASPRGDVLVAW